MYKILITDDEEDIRALLEYNLKKEGYSVRLAKNGEECLQEIQKEKPDLVLLDIMMPGMDGIEVCELIKKEPSNYDILICFLTARFEDFSQIAGLEAGADDYINKPIKPKVLLSRISALLRRKEIFTSSEVQSSSGLKINRDKYLIEFNGQETSLPRKEFELLDLLMSRPGSVVKREEILETVWGTEIVVGDRTIDVHIRKIRSKIGPEKIQTIKGIGYKYIDS